MKQIDENIFYLLILNPSPDEKDLLARGASLSAGEGSGVRKQRCLIKFSSNRNE